MPHGQNGTKNKSSTGRMPDLRGEKRGGTMENPKIESNPLMEELQQPVYVADMDTHELLYMNRACRQMMHCDDYAGKKCHEVIQGLDAPCPSAPTGS